MSVDQPGPAAPKASIDAPRASSGPKQPPRPDRSPSQRSERKAPSLVTDLTAPDDETRDLAAVPGFTPVNSAVVRPAEPIAEPRDGDDYDDAPKSGVRRARRVKRVVRRIDLWSVLKLALVVYTCLYLASLGTLALLWGVLYSSGNVDKLQSFLADVGLDNFIFYGNQMFRACAAIGAVGVMAGTVLTVLATALINVISEMTGGIRLVVIEEDVEI